MRQHNLKYYKDGYKKIVYCSACSLEEQALDNEPICVGRYVSPLTQETIKNMEERLDTLKSIF